MMCVLDFQCMGKHVDLSVALPEYWQQQQQSKPLSESVIAPSSKGDLSISVQTGSISSEEMALLGDESVEFGRKTANWVCSSYLIFQILFGTKLTFNNIGIPILVLLSA